MTDVTDRPNADALTEKSLAQTLAQTKTRESPPRTDVGTITLHWATALAFVVSLVTGIRIAADALHAPFSKWLAPVLPQGEIFSWHFLAGLAVFFCGSAYAAYLAQHPDASLEAWLDARDEWRDTKRETATRQQAEAARLEQTFTQRATSFSDQFAKAREADPAIESRINRDLLTVRPFSTLTAQDQAAIRAIPNPAERDRVAFLCFLADQWIDSDHAVALVEHLSDPREFQRLATLPPTQVVRELAKVEARLGAAAPQERGAAPRPTASQARPPITPLGTTPHAAADDGSDDEPVEAFIRRENTKDRKAGRL